MAVAVGLPCSISELTKIFDKNFSVRYVSDFDSRIFKLYGAEFLRGTPMKKPAIADLMSATITENPDGSLTAIVSPGGVTCTVNPISLTRPHNLHFDDVEWAKPQNRDQTVILARYHGWALGAVGRALKKHLKTDNPSVTPLETPIVR